MGYKVFDYTIEADDGNFQKIDLDVLSLVWIHRIGPGIGRSVVEISKFFQTEGASYTGGNMAYSFVNTPEQIQQGLPLEERGAHARRWGNMFGIGFAQLGDFNKQPPGPDQWNRAVDLCADLVPWLSGHNAKMLSVIPVHLRNDLPIVGHGEVPAAYSKKDGKEQPNGSDACPGRYWDMDEFRQDVRQVMKERHGYRLAENGVRFLKER